MSSLAMVLTALLHLHACFCMRRFYMVTDPASLEYVLKTKNDSFVKGQLFVKNFAPLLGHGIFTSDGEQWLWQRKLATNIFSVKRCV
jgi:cytochrome P450